MEKAIPSTFSPAPTQSRPARFWKKIIKLFAKATKSGKDRSNKGTKSVGRHIVEEGITDTNCVQNVRSTQVAVAPTQVTHRDSGLGLSSTQLEMSSNTKECSDGEDINATQSQIVELESFDDAILPAMAKNIIDSEQDKTFQVSYQNEVVENVGNLIPSGKPSEESESPNTCVELTVDSELEKEPASRKDKGKAVIKEPEPQMECTITPSESRFLPSENGPSDDTALVRSTPASEVPCASVASSEDRMLTAAKRWTNFASRAVPETHPATCDRQIANPPLRWSSQPCIGGTSGTLATRREYGKRREQQSVFETHTSSSKRCKSEGEVAPIATKNERGPQLQVQKDDAVKRDYGTMSTSDMVYKDEGAWCEDLNRFFLKPSIITTRNIPIKQNSLFIRYTTDDWKSFNDVDAFPDTTSPTTTANFDRYVAEVDLDKAFQHAEVDVTYNVQFAVCLRRETGEEVWENFYGQNHRVQVELTK
ncbi:hypothetical protein HK102_002915 [Quaeritorhiza haematococci]|nr:hypothetical protein HK102_002915 [Quaeritorhiza haematococci]